MKNQKKKVIVFILCISILFSLLAREIYATDEITGGDDTTQTLPTTGDNQEGEPSENTPENPQENPSENSSEEQPNETSNQPATTKKTNANNNNKAPKAKSNNAYLSDLGIKPHDFTGFKYGTTSYEVVVPEDTKEIEVYAKVQDAKATVTGIGKKTLEIGENKTEVVVTAENGTQKTYTINIIREATDVPASQEEPINIEDKSGLSELVIQDLTLSPEFKTDIYEYTVKYIGESTKLEIKANPTNKNYNVEVIGNEDLKEGENTITILVSKEDGTNIATYQITVNKSLVDEEAIAKEEAEKREKQKRMILGGVLAIIIIVAIIVFIVVRRRKNSDYEEELYDDYDDYNDEEGYEGEVPKAFYTREKEDSYEEEKLEEELENSSKEKLKEKFLNNYSNYEENYDEEYVEDTRKRHKGKRFK